MKVVALLLCGLAVAAASDQWEDFKTTYGKSYVNLKEEQYRRSVHQQNQKYIDEHNERFRQGLVSFNLAMNQLGDMTQEEITATMTGYKSNVERKVSQVFNYVPGKSVAATVDWRDKGAVTPVKDQGQCGSCWAFSATGVLEGQHFLKEGELVSLSEQNLVDCSWNHFNFGCEGGRSDWALGYIRDNGGIDTEESYPYEAKDATCRYDAENIGATCTGHTAIQAESETALEQAVNDIGPISVAIDASKLSFSFYESGIYYEPGCSSTVLDHAVLAVGYGEEGGEEYWLVKNSWAESWGDSGYIKMAKNRDNNCGIATDACYPTL